MFLHHQLRKFSPSSLLKMEMGVCLYVRVGDRVLELEAEVDEGVRGANVTDTFPFMNVKLAFADFFGFVALCVGMCVCL